MMTDQGEQFIGIPVGEGAWQKLHEIRSLALGTEG